MIDKNLSQAIKLLRLPLALLIVFEHSDVLHFPVYGSEISELADNPFVSYPFAYLCRVIFAPANAMFFMFSGILFFGLSDGFNKDIYWSKIKKRFWTLFIPYVVWQLIFISKIFAFSFIAHKDYGFWYYIQSLWCVPDTTCPADPPLWFLRDLMVCMLLSPVFYWLIKRWWAAIPVYGLLLADWLFNLSIIPQTPGISSLSIIFFSIGATIGIWKIDTTVIFNKLGKVILVVFVVLSLADVETTHYQVQPDSTVSVVCITWLNNVLQLCACVAYPYLAVKCSSFFSKLDIGGSFVVYAGHWMILEFLNIALSKVCPLELSALFAVGIFICRVILAFLGTILLNRIIVKNDLLARFLAGGRS